MERDRLRRSKERERKGGGEGGVGNGIPLSSIYRNKDSHRNPKPSEMSKGYCIDNTQAQSHCMYRREWGMGGISFTKNNIFRRELSDWGKKATGQISREKDRGGGGGRKEKREKIC